jgi:hypothetical protein
MHCNNCGCTNDLNLLEMNYMHNLYSLSDSVQPVNLGGNICSVFQTKWRATKFFAMKSFLTPV